MTLTTERPADAPARETEPRIRVRDLTVGFTTSAGHREIVRDVSFDLYAGRCLAIVGECDALAVGAALGALAYEVGDAVVEPVEEELEA